MHFLGRSLYIPHLHELTHRHRHTSAQKAREDIEKGPHNLNITIPTFFKSRSDVIDSADKVKTYRTLPIFSGIMIPFSIMLSIPSLVGHWYIRTENNVTTEIRPNPVLLDVGIAFSMACAFLANAFLVVRFAERGIKLTTLASIVFLSLHGTFSVDFPFRPNQ
jgi:potassium channel subfamily K